MWLMFKLDLEKSKPLLETCYKENGKTQTLPTLMSSTHAFMHPQIENVRSQAHFPQVGDLVSLWYNIDVHLIKVIFHFVVKCVQVLMR